MFYPIAKQDEEQMSTKKKAKSGKDVPAAFFWKARQDGLDRMKV
jgi:hypothetical protein